MFYGCLFHINLELAKEKIERRLEEEKLTSITLPADSILWIKKGKELIFRGCLFDIKTKTANQDGSITFTGLFDVDEMQIWNELKRNQEKKSAYGSNVFLQLLNTLVENPELSFDIELTSLYLFISFRNNHQYSLSSGFLDVLTPPPLFAFTS